MTINIYDRIKNQNIIPITKGSDYTDTVTIKRPDPLYPNDRSKDTVMDLTGYTAVSHLRDLEGNLKGTFTCVITSPLTGVITRTMSNTITLLLDSFTDIQHVWGIELSSIATGILPEIQGGAFVNPEVVYV